MTSTANKLLQSLHQDRIGRHKGCDAQDGTIISPSEKTTQPSSGTQQTASCQADDGEGPTLSATHQVDATPCKSTKRKYGESSKSRLTKSHSKSVAPEKFKLPLVNQRQLNLVLERVAKLAPTWNLFKTRSGAKRYVDAWSYRGVDAVVPPSYQWMESLVLLMFVQAQQRLPDEDGELVPIQMYLCYYPDGSFSCPSHKHECRQLTVSIGAERALQVDGRSVVMESGDAIILHGHRHGVSKQEGVAGPRMSLNLFYTTTKETENASVNSVRRKR